MGKANILLLLLASIIWQSTLFGASNACWVGLTRDQRVYMREQLACFKGQEDICVNDLDTLDDGFFKDVLHGLIGKDQAISVDAVHNMLKRKK